MIVQRIDIPRWFLQLILFFFGIRSLLWLVIIFPLSYLIIVYGDGLVIFRVVELCVYTSIKFRKMLSPNCMFVLLLII